MDYYVIGHSKGLFFAILSALFFGVGNTYWKTASKDVEMPFLMFYRNLIAVVILAIVWIGVNYFSIQNGELTHHNITFISFIKTICLCLICSLGLFFYLKSVKYAPVSYLVPITSINIFSILTAVFYFKEEFLIKHFISIGLSLIGLLFLLRNNFKSAKYFIWNTGVIYSLLASFFWGVTYAFFKYFVVSLGVIPFSFILEFSVLFFSFIWIIKSYGFHMIREKLNVRIIKHYLILAFLLLGGTFFYNYALLFNSILELNLINPIQLALSVLIGLIVLQEKLQTSQYIGILILFISLLFTSFISNALLLDVIS
jgi:drug/metabolite transporter (DMT)-like permease